ncbi:hypothetical protein QQS21_001619 [Conoideocrella luteorostrata]|uniref:Uncharacterized protein n=1 Tax=Conoideocrella luteorostrata TaxID=1105319 RepID=A0AAJ0CWR2_9HYPO|nr:hypothetical protein QQS21_001619 [Conoideocrella luteorostrata]
MNAKLHHKSDPMCLVPREKKEGVADAILAKQEAERAKQRELDERDEENLPPSPKRRRSSSIDSVSTISTNDSRRSRSSRRRSRSPPPQRKHRRSPSFDEVERRPSSDRSLSRSPPPVRKRRRSPSRESLSPRPESRDEHYRDRNHSDEGTKPRRQHRDSFAHQDATEPRRRVPYATQSPEPQDRGLRRGGHNHRSGSRNDRRMQDSRPPRQRSLSPFSRRLAMTQSMNRGGR